MTVVELDVSVIILLGLAIAALAIWCAGVAYGYFD